MRKPSCVCFILVLLAVISISFLVVDANVDVISKPLEDNWPMFNHDLAHTGSSTPTGPKNNQTLWTYTTGDAIKTSPAVADGLVYFGSDDGYVYALNAASGSLVWKYNTYGPVQSSPAVVDGVVYIGGCHGHAVLRVKCLHRRFNLAKPYRLRLSQ